MATGLEQEIASYQGTLVERSENKCELCGSIDSLTVYAVEPVAVPDIDKCAFLCPTCIGQIEKKDELDVNHWFCLNESAWSPVPAVQALALRLLNRMKANDWCQSLADQIYMEDDIREWAELGFEENSVKTVDSNGVEIFEGDTVTVIKDLDVKGTSFVAKRGTVVKNVHVTGNGEHVEGRVNGTVIFLKTEFLKKN